MGSGDHEYPRRHSGQTGWGCNCAVGLSTDSLTNQGNRIWFCGVSESWMKTMPLDPPMATEILKATSFKILCDQEFIMRKGGFM